MYLLYGFVLITLCLLPDTESSLFSFSQEVPDDVYTQPINFMSPKKTPHEKSQDPSPMPEGVQSEADEYFSRFSSYIADVNEAAEDPNSPNHNRIKRKAKRKHPKGSKRKPGKGRKTTAAPEQSAEAIKSAGSSDWEHQPSSGKKKDKEVYNPKGKAAADYYVEMPKDLYQAHLRPGVIFRIHMSEAILKMQYRNYGEDKDESVIEADVEYLRLTRKVISDEITKFEDLKWLSEWFNHRAELVQEHVCNTKYKAVGIPPTKFTHPEEYMKRACLFDSVYLDHIPYVIGEDGSLMAAVAPPVLHCDAATCTSVPFVDSLMFEESLPRTSVRTITRCQASCRAHCRNDADCLQRCNDRCRVN
ncbi:hypothetical protein JYU34_017989 [Plutella xylostella]|uniref:Uncharacterized protein n=1 Tax=Plutella xylostella TaxID=51655 RepID=A0ABQ7PZH7_PLUXY|nr:hypothetical protein JYU34_017989 [Plutella xylostella]